jgi:hypothetical protein
MVERPGEGFVFLVNGEELKIPGGKYLSDRFPYFHDPVISRYGRETLTKPDVYVETVNLFFSMALNEMDFSVIPRGSTPEDTRVRKGLLVLARHFGFTELTAELENHFSPQSERFLETFHRLGSPTDLLVNRSHESVLSEDINDFLNSYDVPELNIIVKSALADRRIRLRSEVHSRIASFLLRHLREDPSYAIIFEHLDFSMLRQHQIKELFDLATFDPCLIGRSDFKTVVDAILPLQGRIFETEQHIDSYIGRHVISAISGAETTVSPFK